MDRWEVSKALTVDGCAMVVGGEGQSFGLVAIVTVDTDANLIAAAPELLEALRTALPVLEENARWHRDMQSHAGHVTTAFETIEQAKSALAKANPQQAVPIS